MSVQGLGFLGCRVSGFRVLAYSVEGFKVYGECRVLGFGFRLQV